jgi:hypothetical protein
MAHGGARQGAGKPKGATAKRTQEAVEKALLVGITPLEVMLMAMKDSLDKGELKDASNFAKDAAPYCHAKLASTEVRATVDASVSVATKEQKDAAVAALGVISVASNA